MIRKLGMWKIRKSLCNVGRNINWAGGSDGKESACNAGDLGSIPGLGRSPGGGHDDHYNILAWKILWKEEPGGL